MTVRVQDVDGTIIEFPDGTPQSTMTSVMRQRDQERAARAPGVDAGGRARAPQRQAPPQPNAAQMREVRNQATQRLARNVMMLPFGGPAMADTIDMFTDPARRADLGRRAQGAWRDIQQVPSLDFGRLAQDTMRSAQQGAQNLPEMLGNVVTHLPQVAWAMTGEPVINREGALQRRDLARIQGDAPAEQAAASDANSATAQLSFNAAAPAFGGGSALRTGLSAAALDAPFALSRNSDQPLQERLPGALTEIGGVGLLSGAAQGGFNALARGATAPPRPNSMTERVNTFNRAGVRPTLSAVTAPEPPVNVPVSADPGRTAVVARAISENPFVGWMPQGHMRSSLGDTAAAAERLARRFGPRTGTESSGRTLQEAARRWAFGEGAERVPAHADVRNWSADQRVNQLYDDVFGEIGQAERQWAQRGQRPPITADATRQTLEDILGRNTTDVGELINDPQLYRFRDILVNDARDAAAGGGRTFRDLRDLRTYVRNLQRRDPSMRPNMPNAALERIESALTQDINASARFIGGDQVAQRLQTVDRYYRRINERIRTALRPLLRQGEHDTPAAAFERVRALASEGGRQNTQALLQVRRMMQPYEWRQVQATVIDEMGRASKGHPYAAEGAFSAEQFATRYNSMSPDGRRAFFGDLGESGSGELARALDDLARVAGMQKAVERAANHSNTAVVAQTGSTIGGLVMAPQTTIPILFAMAGIGEALTNPMFAIWITSAAKSGAGVGGIRRQLAALAKIARQDPAVAAYAAELEARLQDERSSSGRARSRSPEYTAPRTQEALPQ